MATEDIKTKCRTCLQDDSTCYQLLDYIEDNQSVLEILDDVVPQIHILEEESPFSNLICHQCLDKLLIAYKFQQLCIGTTNHLNSLMVGISSEEAEKVKVEKADEDMYGFEINTEVVPRKCDNDMEGEEEGDMDNKTHSRFDMQSPKAKRHCSRKFQNLLSHDSPTTFEINPLLLQRRQIHKKGMDTMRECTQTKGAESDEHKEVQLITDDSYPQTQTIEKFQYSPERFEESMQDIEDNAEWNNSDDHSLESGGEYYLDYNGSYCGVQGDNDIQGIENTKTFKDDRSLLVPLFEDRRRNITQVDLDDPISNTAQRKGARKRAKKLTPQILEWIEMFADVNPTITTKNMQRKLFEEKNINLSLSTIYCGMREVKTKKRHQQAEDGEMMLVHLYDECGTVPKAAQRTTINMDTAKSVIGEYRKKFHALAERRRPKKLTPEILEWIALFADGNPRITIKKMQKQLIEEKNIALCNFTSAYSNLRP